MTIQTFDLKLSTGEVVCWQGESGEDAARRYVAVHPQATVTAWRYLRYEFKIGMIRMTP